VEKLVYIAWKQDGQTIEEFEERLLERQAPRILELGARALTINVADLRERLEGSAQKIILGEGETISAAISIWLDCLDDRAPMEDAIRSISGRIAGYLVTESVPLACTDRDWPDGTRSPGVTHFTAFAKPERVSDEEFYARWHGAHTPFSFELHPLRWKYVRNSVARPLTGGAPPLHGIVEERFRTLEDYADPERFFGSRELVARMLEEIRRFADLEQMHSTPMSEYIVKS
jgi:hypothetical protein